MDSTVHRRVSGTPIAASLIPSAPSPATPSLSVACLSVSRPAREGRRAPAYPERSGPHPRPGCKPRPP
jgi:hypothetical protein